MADPAHLEIFKKGVDAWNAWRQENPHVNPDLSNESIYGNLAGINFSNTNLTSADLHNASDFSNGDFSRAILNYAWLEYQNFTKSNFSEARLFGARAQNARFCNAILRKTRFTNATLNEVDFRNADLKGARFENASLSSAVFSWPEDATNPDLQGAHFQNAHLFDTNLSGANLKDAIFARANLEGAHLDHCDLTKANLCEANIDGGELSHAILTEAIFERATLRNVKLDEAKLNKANLMEAMISNSSLNLTDFSEAEFRGTILNNLNLSSTLGLGLCKHRGPSGIDHKTLIQSGELPLAFYRGCGLPENYITYLPSLRDAPSIQFHSCFIAHSTKDHLFTERLWADLQNRGVRCYYAPEDMGGGKKIHHQIDAAIQVHDKLLLVLSEASLNSEWVMTEIRKCRKSEKREGRQKLFPIRLVRMNVIDNWECFDADSGKDLAVEVREFFIPDFTDWKSHDSYMKAFERLMRDLKESSGKF